MKNEKKKHEEPEKMETDHDDVVYTVCIGHAMHPEESISEKNFPKAVTFISKERMAVLDTPGNSRLVKLK